MSKILILVAMLLIIISIVWAEPVEEAIGPALNTASDAKVMVCSAYPGSIYLSVTDENDDVVMETDGIPQYAISRILSTLKTGYYYLSYKINTEDEWEYYYDENDADFQVELIAGKVCCIIVGENNDVFVNQLDYKDGDSPKLCFINMGPGKLNRMEIGTAYTENYESYTADLESLDMTDFVSINPGDFGMFWETVEKGEKDQHLFYPNDDGTLFLNPFKVNQWYVFTAYVIDGDDHANLYEISPD